MRTSEVFFLGALGGALGRSLALLGRSFGFLGPHLGPLALNLAIFIDFLAFRGRFLSIFCDFRGPPVYLRAMGSSWKK